MYANSLKYLFMKFINWERKGNFKFLHVITNTILSDLAGGMVHTIWLYCHMAASFHTIATYV